MRLSAFLTYGLMAIFTQNLVLSGGIGASRLLRAARKKGEFTLYCLMVFLFAFFSQLICFPFTSLFSSPRAAMYLRPLMYSIVIAAVYIAVRFILLRFLPSFYDSISSALIQSAFNGIVFGVPLIAGKMALSFAQSLGFAFGAGIGFAFSVFLVCEGLKRIDNPDVPRAFRGIPASLLYLGILSLAFVGFTGQNYFI